MDKAMLLQSYVLPPAMVALPMFRSTLHESGFFNLIGTLLRAAMGPAALPKLDNGNSDRLLIWRISPAHCERTRNIISFKQRYLIRTVYVAFRG